MKKSPQPGAFGAASRSPDGRNAAAARLARAVDEADLQHLPGLERLTAIASADLRYVEAELGAGRRGSPRGTRALIVDDRQDDAPVYPQPPIRPHPVGRLGRLRGRMTTAALALATIASMNTVAVAVEALHRTEGTPEAILSASLRAVCVLMLGLLPAAVLVWRPDAWRSARLVLVGAVVWGTAPVYFGLAWVAVRDVPGLYLRIGPELNVALAVATSVACLAPAAMAFGLDRARHAHSSELGYLAPRAALAAAFLLALSVSEWDPSRSGLILSPSLPGDSAFFLVIVRGAMLPVEIAGLVLLAYVGLSAVVDSAPQGRLWQLGSIGVVLLLLATAWELASAQLLGNVWMAGTGGEWGGAVAAARAAGFCLLALGFATPAWSLATDAEPGLGAPDEVFAWGSAADATGDAQVPIGAVVMVAAGADHALALDAGGRVAAWGENSAGQCDVPARLSQVKAVAAGDRFSLALRSDGTVVGWGANHLGQATPPADLLSVAAICAGGDFGLALTTDGTVSAWGNPDSPGPAVPGGLGDIVAVAAGRHHALALRSDGTVIGWGDSEAGQAAPPRGLAGVTAIAAGGDFSLALLSDGTVLGWGDNSYGQLAIPRTLRDVTAIAAGAFHGVALCRNGGVVSWGSGRMDREGAHPWRLIDFRAVAAGHEYSLAIKAA